MAKWNVDCGFPLLLGALLHRKPYGSVLNPFHEKRERVGKIVFKYSLTSVTSLVLMIYMAIFENLAIKATYVRTYAHQIKNQPLQL